MDGKRPAAERIVCRLNACTVFAQDADGRSQSIQTLAGEYHVALIVDDYVARGYRRVQPDFFDRRPLRLALQGAE